MQPTPFPHNEGWASYRQKSLGFGPEHPHAVFRSVFRAPYDIQTNGFKPMDPLDVARIFVDDVLSTQSSHGLSYKICKDSYTDKNMGVTHIYVRQLVNSLEVTDGDMNINIKDGIVLSYGSSVCWQSFDVYRFVWLGTKIDIYRYRYMILVLQRAESTTFCQFCSQCYQGSSSRILWQIILFPLRWFRTIRHEISFERLVSWSRIHAKEQLWNG